LAEGHNQPLRQSTNHHAQTVRMYILVCPRSPKMSCALEGVFRRA
jgi:hypothetical protein